MDNFSQWIDTLIEEKGIDTEQVLEVEGKSGANMIPVGSLVETIKGAPDHERRGIKSMLVRLDFHNADLIPYFRHLAQAIAI